MKKSIIALSILTCLSASAQEYDYERPCSLEAKSLINTVNAQKSIQDSMTEIQKDIANILVREGFDSDDITIELAKLPMNFNGLNVINGYTWKKLNVKAVKFGKIFRAKNSGILLSANKHVSHDKWGNKIVGDCKLTVEFIGGQIELFNDNIGLPSKKITLE